MNKLNGGNGFLLAKAPLHTKTWLYSRQHAAGRGTQVVAGYQLIHDGHVWYHNNKKERQGTRVPSTQKASTGIF